MGDGVTVSHLTIATWDHLPDWVYALRWAGVDGIFRQCFFNRMQENVFPPFSARNLRHALPLPLPSHPGVKFGRALSVISGIFHLYLMMGTTAGMELGLNSPSRPEFGSAVLVTVPL